MAESSEVALIKNAEKALAALVLFSEKTDDSGKQYKQQKKFKDKMDKAMKLFGRLCEGLGQTEYGSEPYTGPEMMEKYKDAVSQSWGSKEEPKGSVKAITAAEIVEGADNYERRKEQLTQRRQQLLLEESEMKKLYIEQAKAAGNTNVEDELDAEDIVDQALQGKRHPNRPAMVKSTYKSLFGGDIQRRISAGPAREDHDDYNGYQQRLLKEGDDIAPSKEELAANYERGLAARRSVMEERQRRSDNPQSHIRRQQPESEEDDSDGERFESRGKKSSSRSGRSGGMNELDAGDVMARRNRRN